MYNTYILAQSITCPFEKTFDISDTMPDAGKDGWFTLKGR